MTAPAAPQTNARRQRGDHLAILPLALPVLLVAAIVGLIGYLLWPTWPRAAVPIDAPAIPVTVAGVLFNVPPAAIRAAIQRHPGAHDRVDLVFVWPTLTPPQATGDEPAATSAAHSATAIGHSGTGSAVPASVSDRLFVTIGSLSGGVLAPAERLRTVYPRYVEHDASDGPDGLAIQAFREGTPYQGEDLIYAVESPERFFARCSRTARGVPAICIQERSLDGAEITLRFAREWLADWRSVAANFDRLLVRLRAEDQRRTGEAR